MAARRLLIVMLVLLGISTLAAALVPTRPPSDETTERTGTGAEGTETAVPDELPSGEVKRAAIEVGGEEFPVLAGKDPVRVGDQLSLTVRCRCDDLLEIPALAIVEPVSRALPARLQILARSPGHYGIRLVEEDRLVARIEIAPEKETERAKEGDRKDGG